MVAEVESEVRDLEWDLEEMELGVGRSLKGQRAHDSESAEPGEASSGDGGGPRLSGDPGSRLGFLRAAAVWNSGGVEPVLGAAAG